MRRTDTGFVLILLFIAPATGCMATFASREPEQAFDFTDRPSLYVAVTSEMLRLSSAGQKIPILFDHQD